MDLLFVDLALISLHVQPVFEHVGKTSTDMLFMFIKEMGVDQYMLMNMIMK